MKFLLVVIIISAVTDHCYSEGDPAQNSIRLVGGASELEGRVEVYRGDQWGTVCDDEWEDQDASVVCRQLGYPTLRAKAFVEAAFGEGSGPIYFDNVACTGEEGRLADCFQPLNCAHDEDAGVRCLEETYLTFGSNRLRNNSVLSVDDIRESNISTLVCATENTACCSEDDFNITWIGPHGSSITSNSDNVTTDILHQAIILSVPPGATIDIGVYQCLIPGIDNTTNSLYIGIVNTNEGNLEVDRLYYDSSISSIFCVTTGGPIEHITWKKNGQELTTNNPIYAFSQTLLYRSSSTYSSQVQLPREGTDNSGNYTCEVRNQLGATATSFMLTTCKQDAVRIQTDFDNILQVCYNDSWHDAETLNGLVLRRDDSALTAFQLTPSQDSMNVLLGNSSNLVVHIACLTNLNSIQTTHATTSPSPREGKLIIEGLLSQTRYECCITVVNNSTLSSIPFISTNCKSATTLGVKNPEMAIGGPGLDIIITLATLLGAVVLTICFIAMVVCCIKVKCCHTRFGRESLECSIMRENPLYESAGNAAKDKSAPESHIYSDVLLQETDFDQYTNVHKRKLPSETEAANPLYA